MTFEKQTGPFTNRATDFENWYLQVFVNLIFKKPVRLFDITCMCLLPLLSVYKYTKISSKNASFSNLQKKTDKQKKTE